VAFVLEPVSAYAEEGIQELAEQSYALLGSSAMSKKIFPEQVAFNLLTRTSKPDKNGFSRLENRVTAEIGRILGAARSPVALDRPRPVFHTYSVLVHVELGRDASAADVESCLKTNDIFQLAPAGEARMVSPVSVAGKDRIHRPGPQGPGRRPRLLAVGRPPTT